MTRGSYHFSQAYRLPYNQRAVLNTRRALTGSGRELLASAAAINAPLKSSVALRTAVPVPAIF